MPPDIQLRCEARVGLEFKSWPGRYPYQTLPSQRGLLVTGPEVIHLYCCQLSGLPVGSCDVVWEITQVVTERPEEDLLLFHQGRTKFDR